MLKFLHIVCNLLIVCSCTMHIHRLTVTHSQQS